jgi:hypothetical protein
MYRVISMTGINEHFKPGTYSIKVNGVEVPGKVKINGKAPFTFTFANNTLFYRVVSYTATWGPEVNYEICDASLREVVMEFTE